ncbi:hypothetical protein K488DRAFT_80217 [Vararia minispora EC-137]|uniref:Uncharacterized protein n=1 Tax=Vararia minispora EC-137 TaxID=1314806 RepID=A0ACB8QCG4_9AGAM|nr:hypothetical protein K488DRAFT_80217 [Vararia minispora EC-137]
MPCKNPVCVVVTGASSGLGRAVTELALQEGCNVVATLRTPSMLDDLTAQYEPSRLLVLPLDVSVKDDVTAAFARARVAFGCIDVVYSNAGYTIVGEVEDAPDALTRPLFDTNFWGAVYVAQEALRFFRDVNQSPGGRLLQVSSFLGYASIPSAAFYSLEALTEGMVQELSEGWNIKTTIIQPGLYPTKILSSKMAVHPLSAKYCASDNQSRAVRDGLASATATRKSVAKYAAQVFRLAQLDEPPLRLALGDDALAAMRGKVEQLVKEMDDYAIWSADLDL